eukprot:804285_1
MVGATSRADSGVTSLCAALDILKGNGKTKKAKAKRNTQLNQDQRDTDEDLIMKNDEDSFTVNERVDARGTNVNTKVQPINRYQIALQKLNKIQGPKSNSNST